VALRLYVTVFAKSIEDSRLTYLLAAALAAMMGFVAILFRRRLTPQDFLYKLASRFSRPAGSLKAVVRDAPYRRVKDSSAPEHRPTLLNLVTSDGSGQACHPDVVHIPEGFGAERWTYWMACTPYPSMDSAQENPEIFASYDGVNWEVPEGLRNPLVPKPSGSGDHNSDPDLVYWNGELWLFYRETMRSKTPKVTADINTIRLIKSADGVHWSQPIEVLRDSSGRQVVSPAVIHDGQAFRMWTVEVERGALRLVRRSSADGVRWGEAELTTIAGLEAERQPWHIDVVRERDRLSAILVSCTGLGGAGSRIHYAFSEDGGRNWQAGGYLLPLAYEFESKLQYRASLRPSGETGTEYEIWYSAASLSDMFSIAYLRMARAGNTLVPCTANGERRLAAAKAAAG